MPFRKSIRNFTVIQFNWNYKNFPLWLFLRDIEGFTSEEVGTILDLSVPAVKSRLHRARLYLRKKLNEYYRQSFPSRNDKPKQ